MENTYAYESITVGASAIGFTEAKIIANTEGFTIGSVFCTLETAQIRFRLDGTDPTSSEGHLLEPGQSLTIEYNDVVNFRSIRTGGTSGVLKASFLLWSS